MFDEDDDFTFSPNSKLSTIFNTSTMVQSNNSSLTYKAPKQPKPTNINEKPSEIPNSDVPTQTQTTVFIAKVVTLWKLHNDKNVPLGKYMIAIIGNALKDLYDMIAYQDKTKLLLREPLGKSFTFYKYPDQFLSFYDNEMQLWNANFSNSEDINSFLSFASKIGCAIVNKTEATVKKSNSLNDSSLEIEKSDEKREVEKNKSSSKEKILSRITKMGQPILPKPLGRSKSSDLSDSEGESSCSDPTINKPVVAPRKFKRNTNNQEKALTPLVTSENSNNLPRHTPLNTNFLLPSSQVLLNPQNPGVIYSTPLPDYNLGNLLMSQNAELKSNLTEINMKLNNLLNTNGPDKNGNRDDNGLITKIKCQSLTIDNLSSDLRYAEQQLNEYKKKYEEKLQELNVEQAKVKNLKELESELTALRNTSGINLALENEVESFKRELALKCTEIEGQNDRLALLETSLSASETLKEELLKDNNDLKVQLDRQMITIKELEETVNGNADKEKINKIVRESMNEAFGEIMANFNDADKYSSDNIQRVLLDNLKKTSFKLMKSLSQN
ncbi:hypothetical protein ABEB36_005553 [Hypothenemus hampei]|uniref:Uncharacterized protein n=1 Tax=Hypothenemus hampei TaxID=57062 RepID=A0ABD1EZ93_HYPHA